MNRKILMALVLVAIVAVSGIAIYFLMAPKQESAKITLVVMDGWTDAPLIEPMRLAREKYMSLNPNIQFDWRLTSYADHVTAFTADKAAGAVPDIINTYVSPMAVFYRSGDLLPVDDLINELGGTTYFFKDALAAYTWQGHIWGVPHQFSTYYILYRKDLFAKYNVTVPTTWDGIVEAAKKLTLDYENDGTIDVYGWASVLGRNYMAGDFFLSWLKANGGVLVDAQGKVQIDTSQAIEALGYMRELSKYQPADVTTWGWTEMQRKWYEGGLAMEAFAGLSAFDHAYLNNRVLAKNTGIIPLPYGPSGSNATVGPYYLRGATSGWVITNETKHPAEAKAWLKWLFTAENYWEIAKSMPSKLTPDTYTLYNNPEYWNLTMVKDLKGAITTYIDDCIPHNLDPVMHSGVFDPKIPTLISGLYVTDLLQEVILQNGDIATSAAKYKTILQNAYNAMS